MNIFSKEKAVSKWKQRKMKNMMEIEGEALSHGNTSLLEALSESRKINLTFIIFRYILKASKGSRRFLKDFHKYMAEKEIPNENLDIILGISAT